jgi:hypothetical protein
MTRFSDALRSFSIIEKMVFGMFNPIIHQRDNNHNCRFDARNFRSYSFVDLIELVVLRLILDFVSFQSNICNILI